MAGFLLVLLLAIVGAAGSASAESVQLKLMTYNVKAPGWNPDRRAQVVGAIEAEAPDVLAPQEAAPASSGPELATDLSAAYEPHMTGTENPIYLLRAQSFLVLEQGVEDLPTCTEVPVGNAVLTWVRIETPGGLRSTIYNTHFCLSMHPIFGGDPEGNQVQAVATVEFMEANGEVGRPDFLAGDLNADSNTPTVLFLLEQEPVEI